VSLCNTRQRMRKITALIRFCFCLIFIREFYYFTRSALLVGEELFVCGMGLVFLIFIFYNMMQGIREWKCGNYRVKGLIVYVLFLNLAFLFATVDTIVTESGIIDLDYIVSVLAAIVIPLLIFCDVKNLTSKTASEKKYPVDVLDAGNELRQ
jgi:hypothetical protein